jgi:hypothetical protein
MSVPGPAVIVGVKGAVPQVLEALAGEAITSPAGRVSVKLRVASAAALAELSIVKVSVLF